MQHRARFRFAKPVAVPVLVYLPPRRFRRLGAAPQKLNNVSTAQEADLRKFEAVSSDTVTDVTLRLVTLRRLSAYRQSAAGHAGRVSSRR